MIYLDNAATTYPKPQTVKRALTGAASVSANPGRGGYKMAINASSRIYDCRVKAASMFGCKDIDKVIFTSSCTMASNMVIKGMLHSGDHVVVSDLEHNAVMRPLSALGDRGVSFSAVRVSDNDEETLSRFRDALRDSTKLVICTQISNVWGVRLPVERIAALCREYGIPVMIDAAQSAGVVKINADESGFDFVCIPGHKGLYGTMGTGILIARRPELLKTIIEGGTGSSSRSFAQPEFTPDKFESGTPNYPGIAALSAGIDFVRSVGEERIQAHEVKLVTMLYDRLSDNKRVKLYTKRPKLPRSGGVLSFNIQGYDSEEAAAYLSEKAGIAVRAGLHCAPCAHEHFGTAAIGTIRVSPSYFTSANEIMTIARVIENMPRK